MLKNIFKKEEKEVMKNKNIKYLEKYEADLITGLFYDYTRQLPQSTLIEFHRIYEEESGNTMNMNYGCSTCILQLVRQLAKLYFKDNMDRLPEDLRNRGKI